MDMVQMGEFLATLRKEKKLTQAELGEKLGVTNKTVSRWETGNYLPPVEMLEQLSELYGLTINELLCGKKLEQEEFKEVAEENIKAALAASAFDLKEKIVFFKKKWLRENKARLALGGIIWLAVLIVLKFQCVQPAVLGGIGGLLAVILYMYFYNSMMSYVEKNAYDGSGRRG
ncbi:MAG: helix-turn-helix domain-containing protein [Acetatifactor sp.]